MSNSDNLVIEKKSELVVKRFNDYNQSLSIHKELSNKYTHLNEESPLKELKEARKHIREHRYLLQNIDKENTKKINEVKKELSEDFESLILIIKPEEERIHFIIQEKERKAKEEKERKAKEEKERIANIFKEIDETYNGLINQINFSKSEIECNEISNKINDLLNQEVEHEFNFERKDKLRSLIPLLNIKAESLKEQQEKKDREDFLNGHRAKLNSLSDISELEAYLEQIQNLETIYTFESELIESAVKQKIFNYYEQERRQKAKDQQKDEKIKPIEKPVKFEVDQKTPNNKNDLTKLKSRLKVRWSEMSDDLTQLGAIYSQKEDSKYNELIKEMNQKIKLFIEK